MLRRALLWLRSVFLRRRLEREMEEEMRAHLERSAERLEARGLTPEDARRAARREFGNMEYLQEHARDARGGRWVESILADARFAFRHYARTPLSTITIIALLVLGIGSNAAVFTVMSSFMTRPAPGVARDPAVVRIRGIVRLNEQRADSYRSFSYPEAADYAARRDLFSEVAAWAPSLAALDLGDPELGAEQATVLYVTDSYFRLLGIEPVLGAGLPAVRADEPRPPLAAVINHGMWDQRFGRSPSVLGKTIKVNDVAATIVGVVPPRFLGADPTGEKLLIWMPLADRQLVEKRSGSALLSYDSAFLSIIARLQPGKTIADATPAVATIAARARAQATRAQPWATTSDVVPLLRDNLSPQQERSNWEGGAYTGAVTILILLLTCTNVSALLVGLAIARKREIAVRLSLGASRARLVRQLVTETAFLAAAAAGLSLMLIYALIRVLAPRFIEFDLVLEWSSLLFTFSFAIATGILFGLSPALHATRMAVGQVLKESGAAIAGSRSWLQRGLVVAQVALTQPMLVGLGTFVVMVLDEFGGTRSSPVAERVLKVEFNAFGGGASLQQRREDLRRVRERVAGLPGVIAVTEERQGQMLYRVAVHPLDRIAAPNIEGEFRAEMTYAAAGYFDMLGIQFVRGRDFAASERTNESTAIVISSDVARDLWGTENPLGRRLRNASSWNGQAAKDTTDFIVVGVVDEKHAGKATRNNRTRVYVPFATFTAGMLVQTHGRAGAIVPSIRAAAAAEAPYMPISRAETLAEIEARENSLMMKLSSAAAAGSLLTLFLSAIGLYAIVAFAVNQRRNEIGIRTALGATPGQVCSLFFGNGIKLSAIGLLLGLPLSMIGLRIFVLQTGIPRPPTLTLSVLIALTVVAISAVATWIPARGATRIDPLIALRSE